MGACPPSDDGPTAVCGRRVQVVSLLDEPGGGRCPRDDTLDVPNTYVRIDGPSLWIEFNNQPALAVNGIHHHTIYRDETTDYGGR